MTAGLLRGTRQGHNHQNNKRAGLQETQCSKDQGQMTNVPVNSAVLIECVGLPIQSVYTPNTARNILAPRIAITVSAALSAPLNLKVVCLLVSQAGLKDSMPCVGRYRSVVIQLFDSCGNIGRHSNSTAHILLLMVMGGC